MKLRLRKRGWVIAALGFLAVCMAGDEWCCGFPLVGSGQSADLPAIIKHNVEAVKARGARKVVFTCPSCYQIWRESYPPEFELEHASEMVMPLWVGKAARAAACCCPR